MVANACAKARGQCEIGHMTNGVMPGPLCWNYAPMRLFSYVEVKYLYFGWCERRTS